MAEEVKITPNFSFAMKERARQARRLCVSKETQRWRGRPLGKEKFGRQKLWGFVARRSRLALGGTVFPDHYHNASLTTRQLHTKQTCACVQAYWSYDLAALSSSLKVTRSDNIAYESCTAELIFVSTQLRADRATPNLHPIVIASSSFKRACAIPWWIGLVYVLGIPNAWDWRFSV